MRFTPIIGQLITTGPKGDADVLAWARAVTSNGGTVSPVSFAALNTFVTTLKSDGTWDMILDCCVFDAYDPIAASIKLKAFTGTSNVLNFAVQGSPGNEYFGSMGFLCDGATAIDTGVDLNSISTNGEDLHMGIMCLDGFDGRPMGVSREMVLARHYLPFDTLAGNGFCWGDGYTGGIDPFTIGGGGFCFVQGKDGQASLYADGSFVDSFTINTDGTINQPADLTVAIGSTHASDDGSALGSAGNGNTVTYEAFTDRTIQFYSIGRSMTDSQILNFNNALYALQTAYGR